jgi:hypothetical protein
LNTGTETISVVQNSLTEGHLIINSDSKKVPNLTKVDLQENTISGDQNALNTPETRTTLKPQNQSLSDLIRIRSLINKTLLDTESITATDISGDATTTTTTATTMIANAITTVSTTANRNQSYKTFIRVLCTGYSVCPLKAFPA